MKRVIALFCVALGFVASGYGKQLNKDSLSIIRQYVSVVELTDALDDYLKIIQHFKPVYVDSISYYVDKLEQYTKLDTSMRSKAHFAFEKGYVLFKKNELKEGHKHFLEAEELFAKLNDTLNLAWTYKRLAVDYFYMAQYDKAVDYSMRALKIYEERKMYSDVSDIYSYLDNCYKRLWQYDLALEYAQKNIDLAKELKDTAKIGVGYTSMASIKLNQKKIEEAEEYYIKALECYDSNVPAHESHIVSIKINLSIIYTDHQGKHEKAIKLIREALKYYKKQKDVRGQIYSFIDLSGAENKLKHYKKSNAYLDEALELAKKKGLPNAVLTILNQKHVNSKERNDFKTAYENYYSYTEYRDSMLTIDKNRIATELKEKYESEKKEKEIALLKSEKELQDLKMKQHRIGVVGLVVLAVGLLVILLFIYSRNRERKKMNDILARKNEHIEQHNQKISEMNTQYRKLNKELTISEEKLKEINASKDKFFSIIAHDLKNPFHTILGFSFLLQQNGLELSNDEVKNYSLDIYRATNQVYRLLENLLNWASSQTGRIEYNPQELDLFDVVDEVKNAIEPIAEKKDINLKWNIEPDVMIKADDNMLAAVIRNLMSNAVKFTEEKGTVELWSEKRGNEILVFVKDNGVGMSEEDAQKIFMIDSKFRREGTNDETGSGLGLIVCKEFINKHNGVLKVESKEGEGSKFWFNLPSA
ncbi:sensor histidine kinase [Prolixibacteraceae bacterium JC049]|nr:sensor histidine kinase [Prolixibacteraceae bacterium JC049]